MRLERTRFVDTDHIAQLRLWSMDLMHKMEACKADHLAHQEWLYQYLRVSILLKNAIKGL